MFYVVNCMEYGDDTQGSIHLLDEYGEIVMWDSQEWIDEPSLVGVIVNAVHLGYTVGPWHLRELSGRTDPRTFNYLTPEDYE